MKMKLNTLTLAIAAAGFIGTAAQAADAVMFPYVVNSATVATLVTVVDRADATVTATTPQVRLQLPVPVCTIVCITKQVQH